MAIVGEAHVEIHTITKAVASEIRKGLQEAISGEGSRLGKSFSDEFSASVESNLDKSFERINAKLEKEYGKSGRDTGKKFGDEFAKAVGDEADKSGKKFGDSFGKSSSSGVTSSAEKAAAQVSKTFDEAGSDSGNRFLSKFSGILKSLNTKIAKPDVDTSEVDAKIAKTRKLIADLHAEKANPKVDTDIKDVQTKITRVERELEELGKLKPSPEVQMKIEEAEVKLARLQSKMGELERKKATANVDADITRAELALERLEAELARITSNKREVKVGVDNKSLSDSINGVTLLGRSLAQLALPIAIVSAAPALSSLAASAVAAGGALYTLPAALGAAGFAVGSLLVGFHGLGEAMGPTGTPAQAKKVAEAMAGLAPAARAVATELRGLGDEAKNLRLDVQQRMFQGLAAEIGPLAQTYLPLLRGGLGTVADGFNESAIGIANYLKTSAGVDSVRTGIDNSSSAARMLMQSIQPLGIAFFDIFGTGSTYVKDFAGWILNLSTRFQQYIATAKQSGELNNIIARGVEVFKLLGQVVANLGGILGSVMDAATQAGSNALGTITRVTGAVNDFLKTDVGRSGLVAIFKAIRDAVDGLLPGLMAIGTAVAQSIVILGPAIRPVADAISAVVIALAPLLPHVATLATVLLPPLAAVLQTIAPLLGPIAAGFMAMMTIAKVAAVINTVKTAMITFAVAQGVITTATAGSTTVMGALALAVKGVNAAFMANPIGIIVTLLIGLAAALVYCYENFEGFRNVVDGCLNFVKDIAVSVGQWFAGPFVDFFVSAFDWLKGVFNSIVSFFQSWGTTILAVMFPFIGIPALIYQNWDSIVSFFTDLWNNISSSFTGGVSSAWDSITSFFTSLPGRIGGWLSSLGSAISSGATAAWNWLVTAASSAIDSALADFAAMPQRLAHDLGLIIGVLSRLAVDGWNAFTNGLEIAWTATGEFFASLPGRIAAFFTNLGTSLATFAVDSWNAFTAGLETAWAATVAFFVALPGRIATFFTTLGTSLRDFAVTAWDGFTSGLATAWNATLAWFASLPALIGGALVMVGVYLMATAISAWAQFTAGLESAWNTTVAFFVSLPARITAYLLSLGTAFYIQATTAWAMFTSGLQTAWASTVAFFTAIPGAIGEFFSSSGTWLWTVGGDILNGLVNGLTAGWNAVMAWVGSLIDSFLAGFREGFGIASPSTVFIEIGGYIIQGLINGLMAAAAFIWSAITTITTGIITAFQTGLSFLQGLWDAFWNGLTIVVTTVSAFLTTIISTLWLGIQIQFQTFITFVTTVWNTFWTGLQTVVTTVWTAVSTFLTTGFALVQTLFSTVWLGIQTVFNGVWTFMQSLVYTIWGAIQSYISTSLAAYQAMWSMIWSAIQTVFNTVWTAIQNIAITIWNAISSFFTTAFAAYQAAFQTVWTTIQTIFNTVWTFIQNIAITIWNAIAAFFTTAFAAYQAAFQLIWTTIQNIFNTVWTTIQNIAITLWNAIAAFFSAAFAAYQAAFQTIWTAIQTIFQTVWTFIQNTATMIWNAIAAFFSAAFAAYQAAFEAIWNAISTTFSTIWTGIQNTATSIWNSISSFFTTQFNNFSSFFTNTWNNIRDAFGRAFGGIQDIARNIWDGVKRIFRDSLNAIIGGVNWPIDKINGLFSLSIPTIPLVNLAEGGSAADSISGKVKGLGGRTADRVPAALSYDEHVWSAQEVNGAGGHAAVRQLREAARKGVLNLAEGGEVTKRYIPKFEAGAFIVDADVAANTKRFLAALNSKQAEAVQATGGKHAKVPRFALGGALDRGVKFAQSMHGRPYVWGGTTPAGTDCSGYMGMIASVLRGESPHRIGVARDQPWPGFKSGLGSAFSTGFSQVHTAGTLNGVNVESGGSPSMVKYGVGAVGANNGQFGGHAFLPEVGGTFVSGAGDGSFFDPAAWFDGLVATIGLPESARQMLRDLIPDIPSFFEPMGLGIFDKSWSGFREWVINQLTSLFGTTGPMSAVNTGPVVEQVRAVAKQFGWDTGPQWDAINAIISKESSWDPNAANGTTSARGLFQKMTSYHGPVESTPGGQAQWGLTYIRDRYGTPTAAWAHHQRYNSYDKGGWLKPGITQAINGTGKPEAIIADPMTTFEKSFQKVFKWLAPQCQDALENGVAQTTEWVRKLVNSLSGKGNTGTKLPGTDANQQPPTVPVLEVPPITIPPITAPPPPPPPPLPVGDFGQAFKDALSQFAPDLALSIQAGAGPQSSGLASDLLGDTRRMQAIQDSIAEQLGSTDFPDIAAELQKYASYRDTSVQAPGTGGSVIDPGDAYDPTRGSGNWLQDRMRGLMDRITSGFTIERGYNDQYAGSKSQVIADMAKQQGKTPDQILKENPNLASGSDPFAEYEKQVRERLSKIPTLADDLSKAFPDISKAIASSENDLRNVLGTRASDLMSYLGTKSKEDADAILSALGSSAPTTTQQIVSKGVQSLTTADTAAAGPQLTFADGAFQVNINGNADAVTVQQLQDTLTAWGENIVQEYEGRT